MKSILKSISVICALILLSISCRPDITEIRTVGIPPYTPSDSARANFLADATDFAVGHLYIMQSPDTASLFVPDSVLNLFLYPLACLYDKRHEIPLLDTLIVQRQVHSEVVWCQSLLLTLDTSFSWVKKIREGKSPTGNSTVDSISQLCNLRFSWIFVTLDGRAFVASYEDPVNNYVLEKIFLSIPGVLAAHAQAMIDNYSKLNIVRSSCGTIVYLYYGYGDCPLGCFGYDRWTFSVSNTYEVKFEGFVHQ